MQYIREITIENLRCFGKRQTIDFMDVNGGISQWNVILGDNGTGKTTILRSIVSLLPTPESFIKNRDMDTKYKYELGAYKWTRLWPFRSKDDSKKLFLSLTIAQCRTSFKKINGVLSVDFKETYSNGDWKMADIDKKTDLQSIYPIYCFAYGANRKMSSEASYLKNNLERINETLFKEDALLSNSSEYLLRLDYETAKSRKGSDELIRVKNLLLKLLPEGVKDIKVMKVGKLDRDVMVKTQYGWVRLADLSLGYKTTIAWLIDFASKMITVYEKTANPFNQPAILLIDEIDLHMHPSWQREIMLKLTRTFKKTQFIVTAHSPLIAQSALNSNLILLKRKGQRVEVENNPDIVRSWRIDQVLTSDLFGLKESRAKDIEEKMQRRRFLLKIPQLNANQKKELKELNKVIHDMPVGETKSQMDAMDVLRDFAERLEASKTNTSK